MLLYKSIPFVYRYMLINFRNIKGCCNTQTNICIAVACTQCTRYIVLSICSGFQAIEGTYKTRQARLVVGEGRETTSQRHRQTENKVRCLKQLALK